MTADVYHKFLGIPPAECPPNHYRLLGVVLFEEDKEVIDMAAQRCWQFVKSVAVARPDVSEELLNEIQLAKLVLLDPKRRHAYDEELRRDLANGDASGEGSAPGAGTPDGARRALPLEESSAVESSSSISSSDWDLPPSPEPGATDGEWVVGSGPQASIRVRAPWVSRKHCRLWRQEDKTFVEDLGSLNGTFLNDVQLEEPARLRGDDIVSLGRKTWLPWPLPPGCKGRDLRVYAIGRSPDCDYVIRDKSVSQHHAQLLIERDLCILQDLRSLNGTRVGTLDNRIQQCELPGHLSVFFGAVKVFAQDLINKVRDR